MFIVKAQATTHHPVARTVGEAVFHHMRLLEIYTLSSVTVKDEKTGKVRRLENVKQDGKNIAWERIQELAISDF